MRSEFPYDSAVCQLIASFSNPGPRCPARVSIDVSVSVWNQARLAVVRSVDWVLSIHVHEQIWGEIIAMENMIEWTGEASENEQT